jgi:hypothetical protein
VKSTSGRTSSETFVGSCVTPSKQRALRERRFLDMALSGLLSPADRLRNLDSLPLPSAPNCRFAMLFALSVAVKASSFEKYL